ncbi:MAG: hypothetical protein AAF648_00025 [Pseudomonadota bacterium]
MRKERNRRRGLLRRAPVLLLLLCLLVSCTAAEPAAGDRAAAAQALATLDAFMAGFNARDPEAHTASYVFPHYRLARGEMNRWDSRTEAIKAHRALFAELPKTGWNRSEWVERRVVTASATKVHIATRFRRLAADGSELGVYDSLYVVVKRADRWGIRLRSSFL